LCGAGEDLEKRSGERALNTCDRQQVHPALPTATDWDAALARGSVVAHIPCWRVTVDNWDGRITRMAAFASAPMTP
jgi:hypothetical protein